MNTTRWKGLKPGRASRRQFFASVGAAGMAGLVAACGGDESSGSGAGSEQPRPATSAISAEPAPKTGGTLKVAINTESTSIDPHISASGGDHQYFFMVCDPLIGYDQKGQLDALISLAEKWELVEPTRVVLMIRPGVKFQDGSDLTAEEVKWNLDRARQSSSTPRTDLAAIDTVEVVNGNQVALRLKEPSAPLLTNFGDRGGQILSRAAFDKSGTDGFQRNPIGTGSFSVREWITDAHIIFERNPDYWRKDAAGRPLPYLQQIRFEVIPEAAVQVAALESGQVHLTSAPALEVKRLLADTRFQSATFVGSSTGGWFHNHAFPPMDNLMFRRAFASALDRQTYIKNFQTGDEPLAKGLLTPASWAYDESVSNYAYDIAMAKDFLQRSGLPPSAWHVKAQSRGASIIEGEQFWEASLKAAGIILEWGTPNRDGLQQVFKGLAGGNANAAVLTTGWSMRVDPDASIGQFYQQSGAYNAGQAPVPEVEPLVIKARQVYDQSERKKLYTEIQQKAKENLYSIIPLYYGMARVFAAKDVGNIAAYFGGEGKPRYANLAV